MKPRPSCREPVLTVQIPASSRTGPAVRGEDGGAPAAERGGEDQRPAALPQQAQRQSRQRQEQQLRRPAPPRRRPSRWTAPGPAVMRTTAANLASGLARASRRLPLPGRLSCVAHGAGPPLRVHRCWVRGCAHRTPPASTPERPRCSSAAAQDAAVNSASWVTETTAVPASSSSERNRRARPRCWHPGRRWARPGPAPAGGGQHRGHREPPLLAAGERVGVGVHELVQPQPLQQLVHPFLAVAQVAGPEQQLVQNLAGDELVLRLLENGADPGDQLSAFQR